VFPVARVVLTHVYSTLLLVFCLLFAQPASCDTPNTRIRGSEEWFQKLLAKADATACREPTCDVSIRPTTLTVRTPTSSHLKVVFVSATLAHPVRTSAITTYKQNTKTINNPILLRGFLVTNPQQGLHIPVAASITRSGDTTVLDIIAPLPRRASLPAPRHLTSIQVSLSSLAEPSAHNARSKSTSRFAFPDMHCGVAQHRQSPQMPRSKTSHQTIKSQATYPTLYIATDYDSLFASRNRCNSVTACNDAILRIIHASAVFYEAQLGYTLTVAHQFGPTTLSSTTVPSQVLDSAQRLSLLPRFSLLHTGTNVAENQLDLFHFFTGKTMDNKTIGIAYVGTACRNDQSEFSQAVIQHVSDELNPITAAHETGHTLNALHTTSGIMRPNLSGSAPKSFSSVSLLAISGHLDAWYPECRQGVVEGIATPTPTPTPRGGGSSSSNPYTGKPVTVQLSVVSPSPQAVSIGATVTSITPNCSVRIRAGATSLAALRGAVLSEFVPTEFSTTKTGAARFKVKPSSSTKANVFFVAEHTCPDGTILEVSRVQRFNPNRIRGTSRTQRSKRAWLKVLRESIQ